MHEQARYQSAKTITLMGALLNIGLSISKVLFGYLGHSKSLVADGIHSFFDLLTDALVLIASKYGSLKADSNHPYGHRRIETAASVIFSLLFLITGLYLIFDAVSSFSQTQVYRVETYTL